MGCFQSKVTRKRDSEKTGTCAQTHTFMYAHAHRERKMTSRAIITIVKK